MTLVTLGSRGPVTGKLDTTGLNSGNWTVAFPADLIDVNIPQFHVYKMIVSGAQNTTFNVYVDGKLWDVGIYGTLNSWDPSQTLVMRPGESLFFAYSDPVSDATPPVVTIWLRYDTEIFKAARGAE
jgi:hypothetical protein